VLVATINAFWGEPAGFVLSFVACCWSHFTQFGGRPQKLEECPKYWQLKHCLMGREFWHFSHLIMQWHSLRSWTTLLTSVPGWKVITNMGYLFNTARVNLSVLVSCVIFAVWMLLAASSSRTSSSGTFGELRSVPVWVGLLRVVGMCGKLDW